MKVQSIIAKHLKEAIAAAGKCTPHGSFQARIHMEFVMYLNFMWRDNTSWVNEEEEYEKFLDSDFSRQFKSKRRQYNVIGTGANMYHDHTREGLSMKGTHTEDNPLIYRGK